MCVCMYIYKELYDFRDSNIFLIPNMLLCLYHDFIKEISLFLGPNQKKVFKNE